MRPAQPHKPAPHPTLWMVAVLIAGASACSGNSQESAVSTQDAPAVARDIGCGPATCDDLDPCTASTCVAGTCKHAPITGAACSDGDPCTADDRCVAGLCTSATATDCDDHSPCTVDTCDSDEGCVHKRVPDGPVCQDGHIRDMIHIPAGPFWMGCRPFGPGSEYCCASLDVIEAAVQAGQGDAGKGNLAWRKKMCDEFRASRGIKVGPDEPYHKRRVPEYWIDKYEVTFAKYKRCVAAGGCPLPPWHLDDDLYHKFKRDNWSAQPSPHISSVIKGIRWYNQQAAALKDELPIAPVTWQMANDYCRWLGGQLPSGAQWEKAGRGGCEMYPGQDCRLAMPVYPWGDALPSCDHAVISGIGYEIPGLGDVKCWQGQRSNSCDYTEKRTRPHPECGYGHVPTVVDSIFSYPRKCPKEGFYALSSPRCPGCGRCRPQRPGSKPKDRSVYGVMDLLGNVPEWTRDCCWHAYVPGRPTPLPSSETGSCIRADGAESRCREIRGASFDMAIESLWYGVHRLFLSATMGERAQDGSPIYCKDHVCALDCMGYPCADSSTVDTTQAYDDFLVDPAPWSFLRSKAMTGFRCVRDAAP